MQADTQFKADNLNFPVWHDLNPGNKNGYNEVWHLKLNDPSSRRALWLRFSLLSTSNGFHRVAEIWAVLFKRNENGEVIKTAVKQTHNISAFSLLSAESGTSFSIGNCTFSEGMTKGEIVSKGQKISWDLKIVPACGGKFNMIPPVLGNTRLIRNKAATVFEDLRFNGVTDVNGEQIQWKQALGMQGHSSGTYNGHSWVWGHCNTFIDEQGRAVEFVFDGLSGKGRLGGSMIPTPKLSTFYFLYQGKEYLFNSLWDSIRARSENTKNEWKFQAERGDLLFKGHIRGEHRDFAGITYEDTDGSLLYCANSKLSDMTILIYRKGKLESTLEARGTAALEVVGRAKNPYVPILI
jgi:hypothetical protein